MLPVSFFWRPAMVVSQRDVSGGSEIRNEEFEADSFLHSKREHGSNLDLQWPGLNNEKCNKPKQIAPIQIHRKILTLNIFLYISVH